MKRAKRPIGATFLASILMLGTLLPFSAQARSMDVDSDGPGEVAMIGDAVFVRPVMTAATGIGLVVYTVTLPFSILGNNEDAAAEKLVKAPARTAFLRCLGCTPAQNERLKAEKRIREANKNKQQ
ncbi:MAG: hypothetical protein R3292_08480 [Alcanivorax sp.]|nr:hypothetical protein [Alcanivorax sp.]